MTRQHLLKQRHAFFSLLLVAFIGTTAFGEKTFVYVSLAAENQIARYELDPDEGSLSWKGITPVEADPGGFVIDASKKYLYLSLRNAGKLASFRIHSESGELAHINTVNADRDPAYLEFDQTGKYLLTAYYVAGKVGVHRLESNGAISDVGTWYDTAEKAHAVVTDRSNRWAFVPHTGPNAIYLFRFDEQTGNLTPNSPPLLRTNDGTGPRHFCIHTELNVAYCDNEQGSSVTVFKLNPNHGTIRPIQTLSTLPLEHQGRNSCARLELHRNGKFLYAANRGHDSIAAFSIDETSGRLKSLGQFATEKTPRSFTIVPTGKFLIAAGENANRLAVYRIHDDGSLSRIGSYATGKQPWWVGGK